MPEAVLTQAAPMPSADPKAARGDLYGLKAAYLQHLRLRNILPLSIRQVDLALRVFLAYIQSQGVFDIGQVEAELFEQYKAHLMSCRTRKGRPLHVNTVRDRLFIVQRWFAYLRKKGVLFFDPIAAVQVPRYAKPLPRGVLRQDEIQKVMQQPDIKDPLGYRDRTMMEVLYATGVRACELLTLTVQDVDLEKKVLRVRFGKGGKQRFVPLSTPCCRFLDRYMRAVRPELAQCLRPAGNKWKEKAGTGGDLLFLSLYGGPIGRGWLNQMMGDYLKRAGIARPVSPVHGFRHSVATHLLENGMDIRYVQALLGHESIDSTQIYTHVERRTLKQLFRTCHPRSLAGDTVQPFKEDDSAAA